MIPALSTLLCSSPIFFVTAHRCKAAELVVSIWIQWAVMLKSTNLSGCVVQLVWERKTNGQDNDPTRSRCRFIQCENQTATNFSFWKRRILKGSSLHRVRFGKTCGPSSFPTFCSVKLKCWYQGQGDQSHLYFMAQHHDWSGLFTPFPDSRANEISSRGSLSTGPAKAPECHPFRVSCF